MPAVTLKQTKRTLPRLIEQILAVAALILAAPSGFAQSPPAKLLFSEDFETTTAGEIPQGFTKTGSVGVVDDAAHSGRKSLRIEAAVRGPRRITKQGDEIAALGGQHWGRMYFKVQLPTPTPMGREGQTFPVIHSTLVSGQAVSPLRNDPIEVRVVDTVLGPNGTFQCVYNVQPRRRGEFGKQSKYRFRYTDEWTLAEWFVDHETQSYRLYLNGEEVSEVSCNNGAGQFRGVELPAVFESLSFGWNNYQPAEEGFVAWIDDIALSKDRIGGLPAEPGGAKD